MRNPGDELSGLERRAARGDRAAKDRLHYVRLAQGRPRDYTPEALAVIRDLGGAPESLRIPDWVSTLVPGPRDFLRDLDGGWRPKVNGRFLVCLRGVVMSLDDLYFESTDYEREVPMIVVRNLLAEFPDTCPSIPVFVADLLLMEPVEWRVAAELRSGAKAATGWFPDPPEEARGRLGVYEVDE